MHLERFSHVNESLKARDSIDSTKLHEVIEVNVPSSSSLVGIGLEEATKTKTDMLKMLGLTP